MLRVVSWNVRHLEFTKVLETFASSLLQQVAQQADIIVLIEVNSTAEGTAGVKELKKRLQVRDGTWDCAVSGGNKRKGSSGVDQYGVLWRTSAVPSLKYKQGDFPGISDYPTFAKSRFTGRNPFLFTFELSVLGTLTQIPILCFHAPSPGDQGAVIQNVQELANVAEISAGPAIVLGDFNTAANNAQTAFGPLLHMTFATGIGYTPTTVTTCVPSWINAGYFSASTYDNILYRGLTCAPGNAGRMDPIAAQLPGNQNSPLRAEIVTQVNCAADALFTYRSMLTDHVPVYSNFTT